MQRSYGKMKDILLPLNYLKFPLVKIIERKIACKSLITIIRDEGIVLEIGQTRYVCFITLYRSQTHCKSFFHIFKKTQKFSIFLNKNFRKFFKNPRGNSYFPRTVISHNQVLIVFISWHPRNFVLHCMNMFKESTCFSQHSSTCP